MKLKRKGKSKVWFVLLIILGIIVIGMGIVMLIFEPGRREAMNLTIDDVNFKKLKDGIYIGEYKGKKDSLRNTKVEVTVASSTVTEIKVLGGSQANENQTKEIRGGQSINDVFNRVIDSQSLQVDVISGATITSKVHLKAIENALDQAETK